jgi:hypothetical protein
MHGRGQRTFANGAVYVGSYRNGQRWGGPGCKIKFANGDLHVGSWLANQFHGHGRYFFEDGTALEGNFKYGMKHGKFKRQLPSGELDIIRYENDNIVGQGVRWNKSRTKAWLLKTSVARKKRQHRRRHRNASPHLYGDHNNEGDSKKKLPYCHPRVVTFDQDPLRPFKNKKKSIPPPSSEPFVESQDRVIVKKSARIPIAEAVSIGYDCELGQNLKDTNPAFWSVGNVGSTKRISTTIHGLSECDTNVV